MNMMRYDIEELQLDAQLIESSSAIEGYIYISEELVIEKVKERKTRRQGLLLCLLLASFGVFAWDRELVTIDDLLYADTYEKAPSLHAVLSGDVFDIPAAVSAVMAGIHEGVSTQNADVISRQSVAFPEQFTASQFQSYSQQDHFSNAAPLSKKLPIPDDVLKFIDAKILVLPEEIAIDKVVIQEITEPENQQVNIGRILASADKLFKRDRLLSPPIHNAFARYEKVLSVDPNHPEALQGIKNIVNRYVLLADAVIEKNEQYKVPGLIKKAYQVGEKYMDVSVIITRFSDYLSNDSIFIDEAATETPELASNEEVLNVSDGAASSDGFHRDAIFVADQKITDMAQTLYSEGDAHSAEKVLENFTQLSGFWGSSNDLLLKVYLSNAKYQKAEVLIKGNDALDVYQFAEKAARVMMARGDTQEALHMLSAYEPDLATNENYYVLLASLYNKVGDYRQSVYWYRQLLSTNHEDARLWLGLAVSLDALNDVDHALTAFSYVRQYANDDPIVNEYVNERKLVLAQ